MALNFDKFISENENVSLEDLPIESLVQTDFDANFTVFNKLFEDHLANLINQNGDKGKLLSDTVDNTDLFDLDIDCIDIEDNLEKNLNIGGEPLQECYISLTDLACNTDEKQLQRHDNNYPDSDEIFSVNGSDSDGFDECDAETLVRKMQCTTTMRRQSTRIQNQIRKKIAEQIQRENIRLAKEAQRLNNNDYLSKTDNHLEEPVNQTKHGGRTIPTDLDADDDLNENEWKSADDDPNKLWCICKQPYGFRFMICCDNCSEWYHGDCVGITQEEGARMEENGQEFICSVCENSVPKKDTKIIEPVIISDDDDEDDDNELLNGDSDDDCKITKTVQPPSKTSNIFQIFKPPKPEDSEIPKKPITMTLSARTSVCLVPGCKTLVNPKKSLYCSKKCIVKYTQMVKKNNQKEKVAQYGLVKGTKLAKMTRFVLAQIETEKIHTDGNLKEFLFKNPTYKVFQSATSNKPKQDQIESKKVNESLTNDAVKRVKVVKHFSSIFNKNDQNNFRSIWQQCVDLEDSLFKMCDKSTNEKYMSKVKELSEMFKTKFGSRLSSDAINDKSFISDLLIKTKDQIDLKCNTNSKTNTKNGINKKSYKVGKTGISTLLSDATHLHSQHLYDINCKICNGTSKSKEDKKQVQTDEKKEELQKHKERDEKIRKQKMSVTDSDNINPPTDSCSPESIVTSWFKKTADVETDLSPQPVPNDEFKVTSTVETPDMAVDMEISPTPSASEPAEIVTKTAEPKVDSSSAKIAKSPSKLVNSKPVRPKLTSVWEGEIMYKEVGNIMCKTYLVSRYQLGKSKKDLTSFSTGEKLREEVNLSANLDSKIKINGRIKMSVVQDYLTKLRKHSNKEFLIFRLHPTNLEEGRKIYLKMFEFLHGKDRCGVIDQKKRGLKDCFIYPLNAHSKIPTFFLPLNGPGFEKRRPHMLLMLIVRSPLEHNIYKSFSPKYDPNDESIKQHGINLEKYYNQPSIPEVCPSPIIGLVSEEITTDIESGRSEINNNHVTYDKDVPLENNMSTEEKEVDCDEPNDSIDEELPPVSDSILDRKIEELSQAQLEHSREEKEFELGINSSFIEIFNPAKLNDSILPLPSDPEPIPDSPVTVIDTTENTQTTDSVVENFSLDFDLRVISNNVSFIEPPSLDTSNTSCSTINRSPVSKRFYTFYDAFFNDPDFQLKRAKYFFNPRFPTDSSNSSRSLPL